MNMNHSLGYNIINRYIVGCKYNKLGIGAEAYTGINRYIVGCKF